MSDAHEVYERGIAVRDEMLGSEHGRAKVEASRVHGRLREAWSRATASARSGPARAALPRAPQHDHDRDADRARPAARDPRARQGRDHNGVTKEQISEIMMHSAIYCGVPAAVDGYRHATAVLGRARARVSSQPGSACRLRRPRQHGRADGAQPRRGGLRADRLRRERRACWPRSPASSAPRRRSRRPTSRASMSSSRCCPTTARSRPSCSMGRRHRGGAALGRGRRRHELVEPERHDQARRASGRATASASSTPPSRAASRAP